MVMLMVFNSRAAAISTTLVSVLSPLLATFAFGITESLGPMLFSFLTFWVILCFWQRIRQCFRRPLIVFMDKLCISQKDEQLKERGILGLASFLDRSECLTILWSSRYFSRIWCTFEVAAFLRNEQKRHIRIIPVSFAKLVFLLSLYAHVGAFAYYTFSIREDVWTWLAGTTGMIDDWWVKVTVLSSSFSCLASVLGPLIFYIGINLMKDIDSLRQQLSSFNIKRCKCYCCSVSHQDPVTKMRIPCDREVIFATLEEWYGGPKDPEAGGESSSRSSASASPNSFVGPFNKLVRDHLAGIVRETLEDISGQLRYGMCMVVVILMPLFPCCLMQNWMYLQDWSNSTLLIFFLRNLLNWAKLPLWAMLAFWAAIRNCELGLYLCQRKMKYMNQIVVSCLMTILTLILLGFACIPFEIVFFVTRDEQSLFFPLIPFMVIVVIDLCIFVPALRCKWLSHLSPERPLRAPYPGCRSTDELPSI